MKLSKLCNRKWNYLAIAFAIPVTAIIILMIVVGATPFGNKSLLYSDMWHQYFPFFKAFRKALLSGDSLLYSWNVGMGMDYLGLISYYLASPLNLLSVLLPEFMVLPYFSLLMPIKLGLASLFFALFLKKTFDRNDISISIFGSFYGLCAWALAYQWNIMWLDTFALLPLVTLGTIKLLREKKFILYTLTLALSIFSNYYIGFFTCIFVLLAFICYQISYCKNFRTFILDLCRIAAFSALAIGMTAILELPALSALGDTYSSVNTFPDNFSLNIVGYEQCSVAREAWEAYKLAKESGEPAFMLWLNALWESFPPVLNGMGQVAGNVAGGITPSFKEGLPNVCTGIATLMLSFLFLMAGNVKLREKLCCIFLLLFFILSFVIRQLDYIWHGFHFTNMIPYRFSFLFSFVMLYMAYRAYLVRHRFKAIHFIVAGLLTIEVFLLSKYTEQIPQALSSVGHLISAAGEVVAAVIAGNKIAYQSSLASLESIYDKNADALIFFVYNAVFFILYFVILIYPRLIKKRKETCNMEDSKELMKIHNSRLKLSSALLSFVMVLELAMSVINFGVSFSYTNIEDYPRGTVHTESMFKYLQERDDSLFYRTEVTHTQTLNDGALNGYNGISTFTSSANVKVTDFMCSMGFAAQNNWNRYCFEEASPVANLFLNLKYMMERQDQVEKNSYFKDIHSYGKVHLLENQYYLPLGFLAQSSLKDMEWRSGSSHAFENQNTLFSSATGMDEPVWNVTPEEWLAISGDKLEITAQHNYGYCSYKVFNQSGTLTYRYNIEEAGYLCLDINMYARNTFYIYLNDDYLFTESITLPQTVGVCQVKPGDVVEVRAKCASNENSSMTIRAAILDDDVFQKGYEILNASTLQLTDFSNTKVSGTVQCNRDGLLYTSIPDDGNWSATVDGKQVEHCLIGNAMIALELSQGEHEVVLTYRNRAFELGTLISVASFLIFLIIVYRKYRQPIQTKAKLLYCKIFHK